MSERQKQAILAKMQRTVPKVSPELKARIEGGNDWYGKCRKCGKELTGSLEQMREHKCDG